MEPASTYKSYILRMWQVTHAGQMVWQASLQSTATGQREGFSDLESLFAHLTESDRPPTTEWRPLTTVHAQRRTP